MVLTVTSGEGELVERGVLSMSDEEWEETRHRAAVIGPLAATGLVDHSAADAAAAELGLSRRQVYVLVKRYRQGTGLVTAREEHGPVASTGRHTLDGIERHEASPMKDAVRYLRHAGSRSAALTRAYLQPPATREGSPGDHSGLGACQPDVEVVADVDLHEVGQPRRLPHP